MHVRCTPRSPVHAAVVLLSQLLQGFDDPEVMKAVNEVAQDPNAFKKYQNNPKVLAFYQQMAGFVGERLEEIGGSAEASERHPPAQTDGRCSGAWRLPVGNALEGTRAVATIRSCRGERGR